MKWDQIRWVVSVVTSRVRARAWNVEWADKIKMFIKNWRSARDEIARENLITI